MCSFLTAPNIKVDLSCEYVNCESQYEIINFDSFGSIPRPVGDQLCPRKVIANTNKTKKRKNTQNSRMTYIVSRFTQVNHKLNFLLKYFINEISSEHF